MEKIDRLDRRRSCRSNVPSHSGRPEAKRGPWLESIPNFGGWKYLVDGWVSSHSSWYTSHRYHPSTLLEHSSSYKMRSSALLSIFSITSHKSLRTVLYTTGIDTDIDVLHTWCYRSLGHEDGSFHFSTTLIKPLHGLPNSSTPQKTPCHHEHNHITQAEAQATLALVILLDISLIIIWVFWLLDINRQTNVFRLHESDDTLRPPPTTMLGVHLVGLCALVRYTVHRLADEIAREDVVTTQRFECVQFGGVEKKELV
jgi:hypothetical protein